MEEKIEDDQLCHLTEERVECPMELSLTEDVAEEDERVKSPMELRVCVLTEDEAKAAEEDERVKSPVELSVCVLTDLQAILPTEPTKEELKLAALRSRELSGDQRSADWLNQRNNYITASTSAACAGLMGKAARLNMIKEKVGLGKSFFGNVYTRKGNLFEPVTNMIYSKKTSKTIHMFNLIPADDPNWPFLGASTDGVTNTLENIEIKTLARREITKIKREYFHQMQHQMFCLGLTTSHFIEAKYDETLDPAEWRSKRVDRLSGAIVELPDGTNVYSPIDEPEVELWAAAVADGRKVTYWVLTDYNCVTVDRDPTWIQTTGPLLRAFWDDVLFYREHPEQVPTKEIKLDKCML